MAQEIVAGDIVRYKSNGTHPLFEKLKGLKLVVSETYIGWEGTAFLRFEDHGDGHGYGACYFEIIKDDVFTLEEITA